MIVNELYEAAVKSLKVKVGQDCPFSVKVGTEFFRISNQHYVEDGVYYLLAADYTEDSCAGANSIIVNLEKEADDDCWIQADGINVRSTFPDLEVKYCTTSDIDDENAKFYDIEGIEETDAGYIIVCEAPEVVYVLLEDVLELARKGVLVSNSNFDKVCDAIKSLPRYAGDVELV